jgi:hypothetical protein
MLTMKTQYKLTNAKEYFEQHLRVGDYYTERNQVWDSGSEKVRKI